jgi:hypothetical protein
MADPGELERRIELYVLLTAVSYSRAGSIIEMRRRCGKPNCACAQRAIWLTGSGACGPGRWTVGPGGASAGIRKRRRRIVRSRLTACSSLADKNPIARLSLADKKLAVAPARGSGR